MKKIFSYICAFSFCLVSIFTVPTVAYAQSSDNASPRLMPIQFSYEDTITVYPQAGDWPPGSATFNIEITGTYDAQGNNVISIDSASFFYTGSINCTEHDVEIVARPSPTERGVVLWELDGPITFTWTSPVTGIQWEKSYNGSPTYSFNAADYVI